MRDLVIYHPETGTVLDLSEPVYIVDRNLLGEFANEALDRAMTRLSPRDHFGYRLDAYNMTNLFFGGE
jgi:hypothetical protein